MSQVYFNQVQFAERIGKSTHWLWDMAQRGLLVPLRVGSSLFYSDDMLTPKPEPDSSDSDFEAQVERGVRLLREAEAHV